MSLDRQDDLLKTFIAKLKLALQKKTGWGRNVLLDLIGGIYIEVLSDALKHDQVEVICSCGKKMEFDFCRNQYKCTCGITIRL